MNLARVSTNGQITVPAEIRRALNIRSGDKVLFMQNTNGDIVIQKPSVSTVKETQPVKVVSG
ncbi:MAG: AbrB/MazE/SpoVT family DNA-binding domain-containing protein [Defluviitaleaceae bacterium]|nr:AbrB/MazE/SpoVT family DNA-binding domain-containing protein [Defluviitaleaceae bacterium]